MNHIVPGALLRMAGETAEPAVYIRGLPGALPPGERVLWQGKPAWRPLARRMCHVRGVALYLGLVTVGTAALSVAEGDTAAQTLATAAPLVVAALLVLAFLAGMAWLVARGTEYTLTTRRLVIRHGVALPATLAIPHQAIRRAAVVMHGDGTGDMPIETKRGHDVSLHRIWPHARPWHLTRPQPMLRNVEAAVLAPLLARTLRGAADDSVQGSIVG